MDFPDQLIKGVIEGCYKNLILDVRLENGEVIPAFCPELDYKKNLYMKGLEVYVMPVNNLCRRLKYEVQLINKGDGLVMVNPSYLNKLFAEAFDAGTLSDFNGYSRRQKVAFGDEVQHVSFILSGNQGRKCYVYVVSIYNKQGANAVFPSFINFFEMEMFDELRRMRRLGHETVVMLVVPRMDCADIKFTWNIDPMAAAKIFDEAKNGLKFCGYSCNISEKSVKITEKMKILY